MNVRCQSIPSSGNPDVARPTQSNLRPVCNSDSLYCKNEKKKKKKLLRTVPKALPLCAPSPNQRRELGLSGRPVMTSQSAHVDVGRAFECSYNEATGGQPVTLDCNEIKKNMCCYILRAYCNNDKEEKK